MRAEDYAVGGTAKEKPRRKLLAYRRHWRMVWSMRDELSRQYIHENVKLGRVADDAQLSYATVHRFFHAGKGNGAKGYSLFHGPSVTTLVGIASALNMELQLRKRP